jgi:hypothetical protein
MALTLAVLVRKEVVKAQRTGKKLVSLPVSLLVEVAEALESKEK